jgi:hypothetical protein
VKLYTVVVHYLQMCMKEYGCCPKFKRGDNSTYNLPLSQGNYCITLKNSQVSAMGVKHHYQQHQLRNITASQFKRWRTREYSNQLQTDTHDVYSTILYDRESNINKTTYIWICWLHLVLPSTCHSMLCCELEYAKLIYKG